VTLPSTLHVSSHPAILHKLAVLRDVRTEPKKFREVVRELSWLLGYEALADVGVRPLTVRTPLEEMVGAELADRIGLIPIHVDQVSGSLFADAGNAWGPTLGGSNQRYVNPRRATLWSAGAELSADVLTFWSIPFPVRGGVAFPGVNATGRGTSPVLYLRVGGSF